MRLAGSLSIALVLGACGGLAPAPGAEELEVAVPELSDELESIDVGLGVDDPDPVFEGRVFDVSELALARPGDVVQSGAFGVRVPAPGRGVGFFADLADGSSRSMLLETTLAGEVRLVERPTEPGDLVDPEAPAAHEARLPKACTDGAYTLSGYKWTTPYEWWFKANSTPSTLQVSAVESVLKNAAARLTSLTNDCNLPRGSSASHVYKGRAARNGNFMITGSGIDCADGDDVNVAGFGALDRGTLALTCAYWYVSNVPSLPSRAVEADVRYNKAFRWSTLFSVPATCSGSYFLSSVAVHEVGHVFGLDHVSEAQHAGLTMSTQVVSCSMGAATLGLGDVNAMHALY